VATKAEREWMAAITRIGCIACYLLGFPGTPGVVHHVLKNGRRQSHRQTICLCDPGHHQYGDGVHKISRHPTKTRFEAAYGTEAQLLAHTERLVREEAECEYSA
jgi:hypothetical protein